MPRQQWINYETGKNAPGAEVLAKICRVHACSADWLLGLPERGTSAVANSGGVAIVGSGNTVRSQHLPRQMLNNDCSKCPYKKKFKALEKLISK